jgi:hypothetical protein
MGSERFRADNNEQARAHGFTPAVRSAVYRSGTAKRDRAVSFTHRLRHTCRRGLPYLVRKLLGILPEAS